MSEHPSWLEIPATQFRTRGVTTALFGAGDDGMRTPALFETGMGGTFEDDDQEQEETR
ncbi:hypothetical protein AB0A05_27295 [Streptomyces sp. NPDC046374]|uniref:hypothetical protein n=1 Tax=Streptomyces sp. NPDC046374 TaxID=3154917 RepID=UPI0033FD1D2F